MQTHTTQSNEVKKRIRNDRLIGFRLSPLDYTVFESLVAKKSISVSDYMRRLVLADALHQKHMHSQIGEFQQKRASCKTPARQVPNSGPGLAEAIF